MARDKNLRPCLPLKPQENSYEYFLNRVIVNKSVNQDIQELIINDISGLVFNKIGGI